MGVSWQTPDQKAFIEDHIPLYIQHLESGTVKTAFWPDFFEKWFKSWPLSEPLPDIVQEEGSAPPTTKVNHKKKMDVSTVYPPMS